MPANLHCLQCGSARLRRSQRRSRLEHAVALLGFQFERCRDCNTRYFRLGIALIRATYLDKAARRLIFATALTAAAVAVLTVILWWGGRESTPTQEGLLSPGRVSIVQA